MSTLTPGQIYNAARSAGFSATTAIVATAVALAESGGNPNNRCHNCFPGVTEDSRGLWQINVDAHPDMAGWNLYDPATNARAAFKISNGGRSFGAWSTYSQNGGAAYRSQLPKVYSALGITAGAQPPASAPGGIPSGDGGASSTGGASTDAAGLHIPNPFSGLFDSVGSAIGKDIARIALTTTFVVGGVALAVVGLWKGVQPTVQKVQQQVVDAAGDAAQVAKVAAV